VPTAKTDVLDLRQIDGIGDKTAASLAAAGIPDVPALASTDAASLGAILAAAPGVTPSPARIEQFIQDAKTVAAQLPAAQPADQA
jgi:predicted flap endonuclease-1-like 5' DNA nuclease